MPYANRLNVTADAPDHFSLDAHPVPASGKVHYFGGVRTGKRYVSYHLMPVYVDPGLLEGLSAPLQRRMQGKSCFNFTALDAATLDELAALAERGFGSYQDAGYG